MIRRISLKRRILIGFAIPIIFFIFGGTINFSLVNDIKSTMDTVSTPIKQEYFFKF